MREILFRGKTEKGEWVYGDFFNDWSRFNSKPDKTIINNTGKYKVIPKTVGQYIGIKDENGNKIFDGDIVTSNYYLKKDQNKNSVIKYGEWNCSCCNGVFGWVSEGFVDFRDDDVIVIGNIHDNPEL